MEFELEFDLDAPAKEVYEAWLDSDKHSAMTGGEALITEDEGDRYSTWDGYIWGMNLELQPGKYIKQTWRTLDFKEDQGHSTLEVYFSENPGGGSKIKIKHSNLTETDHHYKEGWEDNYIKPMQKYFGQ